MKIIYNSIYKKLLKLAPNLLDLDVGDAMKSEKSGFIDLNLDVLYKTENKLIIALSHYYKQNGDCIADPDMEIRIYPEIQMAEALTYQDGFGFQHVYEEDGRFYPRLKVQLNKFLSQWLSKCIEQKHKLRLTN